MNPVFNPKGGCNIYAGPWTSFYTACTKSRFRCCIIFTLSDSKNTSILFCFLIKMYVMNKLYEISNVMYVSVIFINNMKYVTKKHLPFTFDCLSYNPYFVAPWVLHYMLHILCYIIMLYRVILHQNKKNRGDHHCMSHTVCMCVVAYTYSITVPVSHSMGVCCSL